jgi:amino acid transporter
LSNGAEFGSTWFGNVVAVLIILDVLAVAIGVGVAATRGMFAMARAGQLPASLATLNSRRGTPVVGAAVVGAAAVGSIALVVLADGVFPRDGADGASTPQWAPMFGWMAGFAGTGLALIYLVVSCAGARGLWNEVSRVKLGFAAAAGTIVAAGAVFGALYKTPLTSLPWALSLWILLGVAWSTYVARRRKQEPALPVPTDSGTPQPGTSPDTRNQPRGVGHL